MLLPVVNLVPSRSTFPGDVTIAGNLTVNGSVTVDVNQTVTGAVDITGDLTVRGGDIIAATATTWNVLNTVATTVNAFGAATTIAMGAATGTFTIANATVALTGATAFNVTPPATFTGDVAVNGGDLTSTATTFNLLNATVTTLNLGGAATAISLGAATGTLTLNNAQTLHAIGTALLPAISFAGDPDTGMLIAPASNDGFAFSVDGTNNFRVSSTGVVLPADGSLRWSSNPNVWEGGGTDVFLLRDAANTLALRNGVNAQQFNFYATWTDASNYEGGYLTAAAGLVTLGARTLGTGSDNIHLLLAPAGTGTVVGSTADNGDLTLEGTSSATKTTSYVILQPTAGLVGIATVSPDRLFHAELADAVTNAVSYVARLTHITSGTPANSIGVGLEFEQETAADNNEVIATITAVVTDVTATAEDAALVFSTMVAGAAATEGMRIVGSQILAQNGTEAAPPYSYNGDATKGWYTSGNNLRWSIQGALAGQVTGTTIDLFSDLAQVTLGINQDTRLVRDAANTLALRNGVNAQTMRLYETYTDASNYELFEIVMGSDTATLRTATAGTGADNLNITITPSGTGITTITGDVITDSCHVALMAQVFGRRSQWQ